MNSIGFSINQDKLAKFNRNIIGAIVFFLAMHIFWQFLHSYVWPDNRIIGDITYRMGLDSEASMPAWFSQILALLGAVFAYFLSVKSNTKKENFTWKAIGLLSLAIAIDEMVAWHELLLQGLHIWADLDNRSVVQSAWLIMLPIILFVVVWLALNVKKSLKPEEQRGLTIALIIYLVGAVGIELVASQVEKNNFYYSAVWVTLEEGLEMVGLWLLVKTMGESIVRRGNSEKSGDIQRDL